MNYENNGKTICDYIDNTPGAQVGSNGRVINRDKYFQEAITWSKISSGAPAFRHIPRGFIFDVAGTSIYLDSKDERLCLLGFCNSTVATTILQMLSPTLNYEVGHIAALPIQYEATKIDHFAVAELLSLSKEDWDLFEISWDFAALAWLTKEARRRNIQESWELFEARCASKLQKTKELEQANSQQFIDAYCLQDELSARVPEEQITLARADREKDCQRLISYAIGCMMGRYSLDEPGLIYAHAGNLGFDPGRYKREFPSDADGILPITDERWFEDDVASRVREFLRALWGAATLEEDMVWLAESLGIKSSETPDEAIRRYLADKFYKDHLQTYKKRPIYWLFSSGKQGAFQALVYLHRYNEGTLARMRAEYVVPLIAKMVSRLDMLAQDMAAATSPAARTKLQKQIEALRKKQVELLAYDEKLRHYADMRITLDLDDGVKVNYVKFGDLVAEAKAITGSSSDD